MHLGYKAVIANLSDIYAMNATPTQIMLIPWLSATGSAWKHWMNFMKGFMQPVKNMELIWSEAIPLLPKKDLLFQSQPSGK